MTPSTLPPRTSAHIPCTDTAISVADASSTEMLTNESAAEELELRHDDRKQYKLPMRFLTQDGLATHPFRVWLRSLSRFRFGSNKVPHRSFAKQHNEKYKKENERDIHLLLPEWLHDKLYCKTCCGFQLGYDDHVRYVGDLVIMVFRDVAWPACGIVVIVYTLTIDASIPEWIHYAGGAFYVIFMPLIWMDVVQTIVESRFKPLCDMDSDKLKWILLCTFVVTCICSPIYGIWALATLPPDATLDTNFGLKLGGYAFCVSTIPRFGVILELLMDICRMKMWHVSVSLALLLLASAIHQGLVGQLVWFPYVAVPGLLVYIPILTLGITGVLFSVAISHFVRLETLLEDPGRVFDYAESLTWTFIVSVMAAILADRNLLLPTEQLLNDTFLYVGGACFYFFSILLIPLLYYADDL